MGDLSCIPVIPSADLDRSLQLWMDGLGFSVSEEMRKDGKLIFCMLRKDNLYFMLNLRSGNPAKPENWGRSTSKKSESGCRAWDTKFPNWKSETTGRPSFFLPMTTGIRIASGFLRKDRIHGAQVCAANLDQ